ncbi:MAG: holo-[acyl-carrier-protein] synthase [Lachnospiraceae bacterium]|nr:holo-[acyl-carrier-protein] synthase [Lachnospiraceae bacterium]
MIYGIGNDLVEIERIRTACKQEAFFLKVFTDAERKSFGDNISKYAGNFAVKEAVAKSFGSGFTGFRPGDVEVLRDENGKPYVNLYRGAAEKKEALGIDRIHVTISNTKEYAFATALAEIRER